MTIEEHDFLESQKVIKWQDYSNYRQAKRDLNKFEQEWLQMQKKRERLQDTFNALRIQFQYHYSYPRWGYGNYTLIKFCNRHCQTCINKDSPFDTVPNDEWISHCWKYGDFAVCTHKLIHEIKVKNGSADWQQRRFIGQHGQHQIRLFEIYIFSEILRRKNALVKIQRVVREWLFQPTYSNGHVGFHARKSWEDAQKAC